jgi:hypothetical protein
MRTAMQQFIARLKDAQESCQAPTMKVIFNVAIQEAEALLEQESQQIRLAYVEGKEHHMKQKNITSTEYYNTVYNYDKLKIQEDAKEL